MSSADTKPTIVFVHGAFTDSSTWRHVIIGLLEHRYPVIAVANPLRGVQHDSDHLRSVLAQIDGPIVLAGHGYGGTVITNAGTGHPHLRALVYVSGLAPQAGETTNELTTRFPGASTRETLTAIKLPEGGTDLYIRQDHYRLQLAADSRVGEAAVMAVTQRPIAEHALNEPSGEPAWKTTPAWFLYGTHDKTIPPAAHHFMAHRAAARHTLQIPGGSHTAAITHPSTTIDLIHQAAQATQTTHRTP